MTFNFKDSVLGEYNKARRKKGSQEKVDAPKVSIPTTKMEHMGNTDVVSRKLPVFEIDPSLCVPWKYHNRDEAWLNEKKCSDLILSINEIVSVDFSIPYGAKPINLYSPELTLNPR